MDYLEALVLENPDTKCFTNLADALKKKLWHQLGVGLDEASVQPSFQTNGQLLTLFTNIAKPNFKDLNKLNYVQFAIKASAHQGPKECLDFLKGLSEDIKGDEQASMLLNMEMARKLIVLNELKDTKELLEQGQIALDSYSGIMDPQIHSHYHLACLEYYKVKGPAAQFFKSCLLYLTYTPLESIASSGQVSLASEASLAAIIGEDIYNFGELLQHDIASKLENTENEWLFLLLNAFNKGDIACFNKIYKEKESIQPELKSNYTFLQEKIRVMALIELVFSKDAKGRNLSFSEIAKTCQISEEEVEYLLIRALSLKVIKGTIDQVEGKVRVKWVQPRVLDTAQLAHISTRLKEWSSQIKGVYTSLEDKAPELLTAM